MPQIRGCGRGAVHPVRTLFTPKQNDHHIDKAGQIANRLSIRISFPRRVEIPAVQCARTDPALLPSGQALWAFQRNHHHQPVLLGMGLRVRRPQMTVVLLDRLTHHRHILKTGNESFHFKTAPPIRPTTRKGNQNLDPGITTVP